MSGTAQDCIDVIDRLSKQARTLQVEYLTLVSANYSIQAGAYNDRRGSNFNPSGIASKVLELKAPIAVTVQMEFSEFEKEGAARYL
jgi:hypothetical protein